MSLMNNYKEDINAEIDDDNDSFHSFAQTYSETSDLGSLSNIDDGPPSDEPEFELENDSQIEPSHEAESHDLSNSTASASVTNPIQYQSPKLTPVCSPLTKCPYMLPKLAGSSKMPDADVFDMNAPSSAVAKAAQKAPLDTSPDTEALQKYAFTEIWIEGQQTYPARKRSLHREFTAALDNYFHEKMTKQLTNLSLDDKPKGPTKSNRPPSKPINPSNSVENEPYVSPFEDMPIVAKEKVLPGQKQCIVVPAGFDLSNLAEYKNPNHWHRRPTTRNDCHP